jgi:PIN domain nuclease of toxin-antitoxin system
MRLLFDTHAFLWWESEPEKLSPSTIILCEDKTNQLFISVASIWEMQIKMQLGKLKLKSSLKEIVERQRLKNDLQILSIELNHVLALNDLPDHHKDPFDRLLISQAKVDDLSLISGDKMLSRYDIDIIW